jgi:hypothetical protein
MTELVDCIREVVERHRKADSPAANGDSCQCGAKELSDHSHHVAQEVIARLRLRPEPPSNVKDATRYVSAWFDHELTALEGAE